VLARCFLALEVGEEALGAAADAQRLLSGFPPFAAALETGGVRKAARESMHITIKFLGQVDVDEVARKVFAAVAPLVATSPALPLGQGRLEGFPSLGRAHVLVLECDGADARLAELAARAEQAAEASGVAREERAFRPHLTLARSRKDFDARKIAARIPPRPLGLAGRLVLFESADSRYVALDAVSPTTPRSESC
jgi:2'-5' RNA ligase